MEYSQTMDTTMLSEEANRSTAASVVYHDTANLHWDTESYERRRHDGIQCEEARKVLTAPDPIVTVRDRYSRAMVEAGSRPNPKVVNTVIWSSPRMQSIQFR
jgi:hypothetical protein